MGILSLAVIYHEGMEYGGDMLGTSSSADDMRGTSSSANGNVRSRGVDVGHQGGSLEVVFRGARAGDGKVWGYERRGAAGICGRRIVVGSELNTIIVIDYILPILSSVVAFPTFVCIATSHCVGLCGSVLAAGSFVGAQQTVVAGADPVAMCPAISVGGQFAIQRGVCCGRCGSRGRGCMITRCHDGVHGG
jgi:hypothetical protein